MDMNDLYLVLLRLHGWEFMAEASHINAKKAVRGFASDLQDFHEQGQRSSAAQLMQHGASAVAVAAVEDALQPCVANDQSQLMGMFGKFFDKLEARDDKLGKFFDKLDARDVKQDTRNTVLYDTMGTLVVAIKENHDVVQQNFQIIQEKLADTDAKMAETDAIMADNKAETDAKMADNKTETDAKMADNKAETDAKMAENKAETDAKIAEIMNALSKVATGSAPANLAMRKNQRYTAESKKITLQWLVKHISNPYPDRDEMECLQNKTGVDTIKRMTSLVTQIRTKEMVKDKNGKWCKRTTTKPSVLGKKRAWTQKNINDMM